LEIAIELAWLGDPVTFPCQLAAHLSDAGAEVRGYVPNKAARDRALQLARLNCPLPVVDQLHIHASVAENQPRCRPELLQHAIAAALRASFGNQLGAMQVTCNDKGEVTVTGSIGSQEDKLGVSLQLRRVAGCTCVNNQLRVAVEESRPAAPRATTPERQSKLPA